MSDILRLHIELTALDESCAARHLGSLARKIERNPDAREWVSSNIEGKATAKVSDSGAELPKSTGSKQSRRERSALQLAIKCVEEDLAQCLHAAHIVEGRREYDNARKFRQKAKGREEALRTLRKMLPVETTREEGEG